MKRFVLPAAFAALLALQILPSATLAWQQTARLHEGRPIRLAVEPRDPRDLLRGEYSVRTYEIGRPQGIGVAAAPPGCDLSTAESCTLNRRAVYVRLAPDADGFHRATDVTFEPPKSGEVFIAGTINGASLYRQGAMLPRQFAGAGRSTEPVPCERPICFHGTITYGIEKWYGPQGVPAKLDRVDRKDIAMDVRVAADGHAVIDGVRVGGEPFAKTARLW